MYGNLYFLTKTKIFAFSVVIVVLMPASLLGEFISQDRAEKMPQIIEQAIATPTRSGTSRVVILRDSIRSLDLRDMEIEDGALDQLANSVEIEAIYLSRTNICDDDLQSLVNVNGLKSLVITEVDIGDAGAEFISKIEGLRSLQLSDTRVGDIGVQHILDGCVRLELLYLKNNTLVTDKSVKLFSDSESLIYLHLANTSVSSDAVIQLHNAKPRAFIAWSDDGHGMREDEE